ncbi:Hemicentin-2 Precursor [Channa argus]|uniref:Hemicentin-2 n=1 Tax=Channa argus TaxID=215402 RepID=A0A6G1QCN3_CHAAH|nr:Hemicentin-2 Precursor [Channa argus]
MSKSTLFVRLFLGFILTVTGVHTSCPIEITPTSVVVRYGDPVSINCSTSEVLFEGLGWEATESGTGIRKVNHLSWNVERLTDWMVSTSCFINPLLASRFEQCQRSPKITLYTFPEEINITSTSESDVKMKENETYNFICDIQRVAPVQNLTVNWYKGEERIHTDTFNNTNKKPVNPSPVLSYTTTRADNGVTIRCEAHMDLGPEGPQLHVSSQEYHITVYFGPDVQCSSIELRENGTLKDQCSVEGNPTPSVTWLKDGQPTNLNVSLSRENAGIYEIKAEGFSSVNKRVHVHVLYGPELRCESIYTVLEYAPHNITCRVEGYPKPQTTWFRLNEVVELPQTLTRSDAGQYVINASNNHSSVNFTVEIIVSYPPSQITELEDSVVMAGSDFELKCSTTGNPQPKYTWDYYRTTNVMEKYDNGVSILVIGNATAYNMGSYRCYAQNERGNVSKTVRVIVRGVHTSCPIEITPTSVVVRYGDPVSINCSTSEVLFEGLGWEATESGTGIRKVNHLSWNVERLTDWMVSTSCFINPLLASRFEQCQRSPKITLYTFPEEINITSTSDSDIKMKENETYNFICDIQRVAPVQNLTVNWYKGEERIHTDTFNNTNKKPVNPSPVLSYTTTRADNGVTIRCEAHMDLGPEGPQLHVSSQEYHITVYFGPDVQCSSIELRENGTLKDQCSVEGNPTPSVTWLKDGQPTNLNVSLSRENAGIYEIKAEGFSSVNKRVHVHVLYGPELRCESTYTVLEYAPHNITCRVEGYPKPQTTWFRLSEVVELPQTLTKSDAGQYVINASTNQSSVNFTVEIIVSYPPSQITELEDSVVMAGSDFELKCSTTGNPQPKYTWDYYRTTNVMEKYDNGVSILVIGNATAYNMGSYRCYAQNERGNVSKTVRVIVRGAEKECPIEITPDRMLIRYKNTSQSAKCKVTSTDRNVKELYWQDTSGIKIFNESWLIDPHKDWDPRPVCFATFVGIGKCHKHLNITLYKAPDSVFIRPVDYLSSVEESKEFRLQCDIINIAPVQNLTVQWYQENNTFEPPEKAQMKVTGCLPENNTNCNISVIRSLVNVSSIIKISLNKQHRNVQFRCEAKLNLGPDGPPHLMSSPLNLTVGYKPTINITKLPNRVPVFRGYTEDLVCEADGNPSPEIQWISTPETFQMSGKTLTIQGPGIYNCTAINEYGSSFHVVEAVLTEDYLPLIAGFVAVTVVAISVIFLFIYSIYYKNTKMRRYSLKNPKLSTRNSSVAHNGWDLQFPMTKLS